MNSSKNIIVTGAGKGIGFELVKWFLGKNHKVWAISRNINKLNKVESDSLFTSSVDITNECEIKNWVNGIKKLKFDILVNNAGYLINKPFEKTSIDEFKQIYDVNVFGLVSITKKIIPSMKSESHIVNISSMGGISGTLKFPGLSAYSSSKGAVSILTELLAEEYKETGPYFNSLALGSVQTEMLQKAFPGYNSNLSPKKIADYICKFALEGHNFYNGKVLPVTTSNP